MVRGFRRALTLKRQPRSESEMVRGFRRALTLKRPQRLPRRSGDLQASTTNATRIAVKNQKSGAAVPWVQYSSEEL